MRPEPTDLLPVTTVWTLWAKYETIETEGKIELVFSVPDEPDPPAEEGETVAEIEVLPLFSLTPNVEFSITVDPGVAARFEIGRKYLVSVDPTPLEETP